MKILIVDDNSTKISEIVAVLKECDVSEESVHVELCAARGLTAMKKSQFDILILDLLLPFRLGEAPIISGGADLLKRMLRGTDVKLPEAIIGLSENVEAIRAAEADFSQEMWRIEFVSPENSEWRLRLKQKIQYVRARSQPSPLASQPKCDVLFVCALLKHELVELHRVVGGVWQETVFEGDPALYFKGEVATPGGSRIAYSIKPTEMGLVAATAATCKAIMTLRPRLVVMTGVCAGRKGDSNLGDAIVASQTWDYGSGKFAEVDGKVVFSPSPTQVPAPAWVANRATAVLSSVGTFKAVFDAWEKWKPGVLPSVHFSPMASGAAVQNYKEFFGEVADQHRKILGVDMEAFGVAWACHSSLTPAPEWLVVKCVSDFADGSKDDRIHEFSSYFSAHVALTFVRSFFANGVSDEVGRV